MFTHPCMTSESCLGHGNGLRTVSATALSGLGFQGSRFRKRQEWKVQDSKAQEVRLDAWGYNPKP